MVELEDRIRAIVFGIERRTESSRINVDIIDKLILLVLVHLHVLEDRLCEDSDELPVKAQVDGLYVARTMANKCHVGPKLEEWIARTGVEESWWCVMCMREKCVHVHPDRPTCTCRDALSYWNCVTRPAQQT